MFITNNSNKSRKQFLKELEGKGIDFGSRSEDEKLGMMISASYTTAVYLKSKGLERPFIITADTGILEECRQLGITKYFATVTDAGETPAEFEEIDMRKAAGLIKAHPGVDSVVVGWDSKLTALKVGVAINYIKWHEDLHHSEADYTHLPLIACSGDSGGVLGKETVEGQTLKFRAIGNGAMADIIARSFDPPREYVDVGKPSAALIEFIRDPEAYGVDPSTALMVGDTLQTDIVFGNQGGMSTLLVMTGVTSQDDLQVALASESSTRWPSLVLPTLGHFVRSEEIPLPDERQCLEKQ
jgi:ribonucleotide monophosphatase NagD (HAD superfamily)